MFLSEGQRVNIGGGIRGLAEPGDSSLAETNKDTAEK